MEEQRRREVEEALIDWAVEALGRWVGVAPDQRPASSPSSAREWLSHYGQLLSSEWRVQEGKGDQLESIFSLVKRADGGTVQPVFDPARPLSLEAILPGASGEPVPRAELWQRFVDEYGRLPSENSRFGNFIHLFHKYAWAVPCTYGETGISLYEEFKALAALMHASHGAERPAGEFLLVGGDIPGIQTFVYTITSKGAAKGLRGRSFFLQLLGDAVVRRLVTDLGLCLANVVYAAGGNFLVLAPEGEETVEVVHRIRQQVNALLLEVLQGDMTLVLESLPVQVADLFTPGQFGAARETLGGQIAQAKNRPLAELTADWDRVFRPRGRGSDLACAVCGVEVDEYNSLPLERTGEVPEGTEPSRICYLCDSFGQLAYDIRHRDLWMAVVETPQMRGTNAEPEDGWDNLLARMSGFEYGFHERQPATGDTVLIINRTDFLPMGAQGFRMAANVTPVVTEDDLAYLSQEEELKPEEMPHEGDIRSFALLAHAAGAAGAIERVGVLRMDVDGLGRTFSQGMPDMTLPRLSALSGAIDLFFSGYLNVLVWGHGDNDLYIIYAGGDDLFVVGAWHRLPDLAEAIRHKFKTFTGDHPALSLSGGITLESARFPLYRAAERAGEAERQAKGYVRQVEGQERRKDALCFLGQVVGWEEEEWSLVREQKDSLLWLVGEDERGRRLPRALFQVVQSIHQLYRTGLRDARRRARRTGRPLPDPRVFLGRWAWMQVYSLTRMARRSRHEAVPERVEELQKAILRPETVRLSGLAARWAEYLTRKAE